MPQSEVANLPTEDVKLRKLAELLAYRFFRQPLEELQLEVSHTPRMDLMAGQVRDRLTLLGNEKSLTVYDGKPDDVEKLATKTAFEKRLTVLAGEMLKSIQEDPDPELVVALLEACGYSSTSKKHQFEGERCKALGSVLRGALREISNHRKLYLSPEPSLSKEASMV